MSLLNLSVLVLSSLNIVWLHTMRWCPALCKWAAVEVSPCLLCCHHCIPGFHLCGCNMHQVCCWWRYKQTTFQLILIWHFCLIVASEVFPGCRYIPDRQKVAAWVLWMQNKQSGMSPSLYVLLSVTLCCPDYCRLLLFENNITIPYVWGRGVA